MIQELEPGDWIRFWYNDRMVLDIVQYIRKDTSYPYSVRAYCIGATIPVMNILEVRTNEQTRILNDSRRSSDS